MRRVLFRLLALVIAALVVAGGVGLLLSDDSRDLRRAGLPPAGHTVATLLDDGTPVFVTHTTDEVTVVDARTPPRSTPDGTAPADLVEGLVAWCEGRGFVDDTDPPATFTLEGHATGPTDTGLGVYPIKQRQRGHVMVDRANPAAAATHAGPSHDPEAMVGQCTDSESTDHHGQALREAPLDEIPPGPYWVVEAAIDLQADVLCAPPTDPLAWPLCPDGGVAAELPRGEPADALAAQHGPAYAERGAYGLVGRFVVHRDTAGQPLTRVWRAPYGVQLRAQPQQHRVKGRLSLTDGEAATVGDTPPLATVTLDAADEDVPARLALEPATEVVIDTKALTGRAGLQALVEAQDAPGDSRWAVDIRHDPLRPPRLQRIERLAP